MSCSVPSVLRTPVLLCHVDDLERAHCIRESDLSRPLSLLLSAPRCACLSLRCWPAWARRRSPTSTTGRLERSAPATRRCSGARIVQIHTWASAHASRTACSSACSGSARSTTPRSRVRGHPRVCALNGRRGEACVRSGRRHRGLRVDEARRARSGHAGYPRSAEQRRPHLGVSQDARRTPRRELGDADRWSSARSACVVSGTEIKRADPGRREAESAHAAPVLWHRQRRRLVAARERRGRRGHRGADSVDGHDGRPGRLRAPHRRGCAQRQADAVQPRGRFRRQAESLGVHGRAGAGRSGVASEGSVV